MKRFSWSVFGMSLVLSLSELYAGYFDMCSNDNPYEGFVCAVGVCEVAGVKKDACYQQVLALPVVKQNQLPPVMVADLKQKVKPAGGGVKSVVALDNNKEPCPDNCIVDPKKQVEAPTNIKKPDRPLAAMFSDPNMKLGIGWKGSTFSNAPTTQQQDNTSLWSSEGMFVDLTKNWHIGATVRDHDLYLITGTVFTRTSVEQANPAKNGALDILRKAEVIDATGYFVQDVTWLDSVQADGYFKAGGGFLIAMNSNINEDFLGKAFGGLGVASRVDKVLFNAELGIGYEERFSENLRLLQGELMARYPNDNQNFFLKINWSPDMKNGPDDLQLMLGFEQNLDQLGTAVSKLLPGGGGAAAGGQAGGAAAGGQAGK